MTTGSPNRRITGRQVRPAHRACGAGPPVQCQAVPATETVQFNLAKAFDTLVETLADRECIVWRDRRLTYADLAERSRRLASYLHDRGLGVRTERADLQGWESGQDHVALALYNGNEYLEGMLGSYYARVAPFNVNYRYVGEELRYLLNDAKPRAMILHSSLAPTLAEVLPTLDSPPDVLLQVEDASGHPLLPGAVWYEEALAASSPDGPPVEPSPDDLYVLYTGGTTGMPKGVLWRQHDIFMAAMGGRQVGSWKIVTSYEGLTERLAESYPVRLMILPPLMHGAAQWACFMLMAQGATLIFPDETRRVDPDDVWSVVEREKANSMTIVGDAVLRPLLLQLDKKKYDLSSFFAVGNGGAPLTPAVRAMAVERIPNLVISDSAGSSETGAQMHVTSMDDVAVGSFLPGPGTLVVDETLSHVLEPGHEGNGWLAQTGNVPLGYLGDPEKTARTFPVIDGVRYSIPGDRARHRADGQIELLGTRLGDGELGRREDLRRGGGAGDRGPSFGGGRGRRRPSVGALGPGGRGRCAAGRGCDRVRCVGGRPCLRPHRPLQAAQGSGVRGRDPAVTVGQGGLPLGGRDGRGGRRRCRGLITAAGAILRTDRLTLRPFTDVDRAPFAELNTHPLVVESLGSSPTRAQSDAMVDRYTAEMAREGWGFWAVSVAGGRRALHRHGGPAPRVRDHAVRRGDRDRMAAPSGPLGARRRHRGRGGVARPRVRRGRNPGDRRLHDDTEHALTGGHVASRHGA